jgi:hypothetical protein
MTEPTPADPLTLWRFIKDHRDAHCQLLSHPEGFELRYFFNGVMLIGTVAADQESLLERARQWRLRLVADGWKETQQEGAGDQPVKGRFRAAAEGAVD